MTNQSEHQHEKVFSPTMLCSYPPKQRWICRTCKETGTDTLGTYEDFTEYDRLMAEKAHEAPA